MKDAKRNAATLVELVIAIVILGISVGAMAYWIVEGNQQRIDAYEMKLAADLADRYMAEVVATGRWDELSYRTTSASGVVPTERATIGPEENSRAEYDDCDDYNGFTASGTHTSKTGEPWGQQFAPFRVTIEVSYAEPQGLERTNQPSDIKRIDLEISWGNNRTRLSTVLANV